VEAGVDEPARERDGEQPGEEQPDRNHLWYVNYSMSDKPGLNRFPGDYYMIQGGNTMLQMGLTQCPS
jgi:hypothetical protein